MIIIHPKDRHTKISTDIQDTSLSIIIKLVYDNLDLVKFVTDYLLISETSIIYSIRCRDKCGNITPISFTLEYVKPIIIKFLYRYRAELNLPYRLKMHTNGYHQLLYITCGEEKITREELLDRVITWNKINRVTNE